MVKTNCTAELDVSTVERRHFEDNFFCLQITVGAPPASTPWQDVCLMLRQESVATWQLWQHFISIKLQELSKTKLCYSQNLSNLLHSIPVRQ
jgi:hypothetical protein